MTNETAPWERGEGERKGDRRWVQKQSSGNDLRRNINVLNVISECKIIQYSTVQLELRPTNQTKYEEESVQLTGYILLLLCQVQSLTPNIR